MANVVPATRLTAPEELPAFALIIRCVHQRGPDQIACIRELRARGLWLSVEQEAATGLTTQEFAAAYGRSARIVAQTDAKFAVVRQTHAGGRAAIATASCASWTSTDRHMGTTWPRAASPTSTDRRRKLSPPAAKPRRRPAGISSAG